jgi:C4-dicarboxylate transporter, DctQ subunit
VLKESDEIRFDLLSGSAGKRTRIALGIATAAAIIVLYTMSMPAAYAYVSFMKVERSSYLKIRFDWLFSIYLVFAVAVIARYLWILGRLLRGKEPTPVDPTQVGSAL